MDSDNCDGMMEGTHFMDFNNSGDDFFAGEECDYEHFMSDDGSDLESCHETKTIMTSTTGATSRSSDSYATSQSGTSKSKNSFLATKYSQHELKENAKLQRARKMIHLRFLEDKAKQISVSREEKSKNRTEAMTKLKEMKESYKETAKLTLSFLFGGAREFIDPLTLSKFMSSNVLLELPVEPFWSIKDFSEITDGRRVLSGISALQRYRKMYNIKMESISRHGTNLPRFLTFTTHIDSDTFMVKEGKAMFSFEMKSKNALLCGGHKEIEAKGQCLATFDESTNLLLTLDVHYDAYELERKFAHSFGPSIYQPLNVAALVPSVAPDAQQLLVTPPLAQKFANFKIEDNAVFCLELRENENEAYQSLSFDDMKIVYQNDKFSSIFGTIDRFTDTELHQLLFTSSDERNHQGNREILQLLGWTPCSLHIGHGSSCAISSSSVKDARLRNAYYVIVPYNDSEACSDDAVHTNSSSKDKRRAKPNKLMVTITKCREFVDKNVNILLNLHSDFLERSIANYKETTDMFIEFNQESNVHGGSGNPMQFVSFMESAQKIVSDISSQRVLLDDGTIDFITNDDTTVASNPAAHPIVVFIKWMMSVEEAGMKPVPVEEFQEALQQRKRKLDINDDDAALNDQSFTDSSLAQDEFYAFDADLAEIDLLSNPLYNLFVEEKRVIKLLVQDLNVFYSQIRDSNFIVRDIVALLRRPLQIEREVMVHVEKVIFLCWTRHSSVQIQELLKSVSIYVAERKYDEALSFISQVVSLDPHFAEGYNNRATLSFARFDSTKLKPKLFFDDIHAVIRLEPDHYGAMYGNSLMHFRMHNYEETVKQLKVAIFINPSLGLSRQVHKILETCEKAGDASA